MKKNNYVTQLEQIPQLDDAQKQRLKPVSQKFVFRTNEYYQSLIDWSDPKDPIRRIVMPDEDELEPWGELDASDEQSYQPAPGIEHKYGNTALLLVNDVCGAYCRFCFRKRLFMDDNDEVVRDIGPGLEYIRKQPEITNVLLTGGDPLLMSTARLEKIIRSVRDISHVQIIRIGSKIPAFNPFRILDDGSLARMLGDYSGAERKIYIMAHFNHPRELTEPAIRALNLLLQAGLIVVNQTPLIRGVNDDPAVLTQLFRQLSFVGVPPYYVFQCRPTMGNKPYTLPVEDSFDIFHRALAPISGLAKRARLIMSHKTGKIEILAKTPEHMIFRYHSAADAVNAGKIMVFRRNEKAFWFDDYTESVAEYSPHTSNIIGSDGVSDAETVVG